MSAAGRAAPFSAIAIVAVIAVAAVGFVSYLLLSAYAPDYQPVKNGGAHAYSTSAVGFAGLAELVKRTRGSIALVRSDADLDEPALVVLTPSAQTSAEEIKAILDRREDLPTLIVMPKWLVVRLRENRAWVREAGKLPSAYLAQMLDGIAEVRFSDPQGRELRSISGKDLRVIEKTPEGQPLLVGVDGTETYILADPDVLDNQGIALRSGAERAMAVIDALVLPHEQVAFDLTLAGFGKNPNLLKLAFEPPFLPLTLILLAAALLAGLHAARRFGPAAREERAVAFGKRALAENGAALLRLARRRHRTGARYVALTRDAAAAATGAPANLSGEALDRYLDRLSKEGEPYSQIAARADAAPDTRRLLAAARDLYHWRRTVTREHR